MSVLCKSSLSRWLLSCGVCVGVSGCQTGEAEGAAPAAESAVVETAPARASVSANEPAAEPAAEPAIEPSAAAPVAQAEAAPEAEAADAPFVVPDDAPMLPGFAFPNYGTLRLGNAYFPTQDTAALLSAGTVDQGGLSWFRGEVIALGDENVTVRDRQGNEYPVPLSYVLQAPEPVAAIQTGDIVLGERFNRAELVIVTGDVPSERGEYPTLGLPGFMSDSVRDGEDTLDWIVPVVEGGSGANAICRGENGVRNYRILRRSPTSILGYDGAFVRVLANEQCRIAPLRPALSEGDEIVYTWATRHRSARVRSVDAATGAVTVGYPWGSDEREDTARFGSIVTELPPELE